MKKNRRRERYLARLDLRRYTDEGPCLQQVDPTDVVDRESSQEDMDLLWDQPEPTDEEYFLDSDSWNYSPGWDDDPWDSDRWDWDD